MCRAARSLESPPQEAVAPYQNFGHAGVLLLVLCVRVVVLDGLRRVLHLLLPVLLRRRVVAARRRLAVGLVLLRGRVAILLRGGAAAALARGAVVGLRHDAVDHREHLLHLLVSRVRGWG